MGVFDFVKEAGAKVGIGDSKEDKEKKASDVAEASADAAKKAAEAARAKRRQDKAKEKAEERREERLDESKKARGLEAYVTNMGLKIKNLDIRFDDGVATISGEAADQATRERAILAVGNTHEVGQVDDNIKVAKAEPESVMHVVESGDTLSKIAKEHYGDANKYPAIFEANKPMLTDPNLIYPGQVLRIPADA